jgi:crotonobetaine/carnitine-CoA ligase
VRGQPQAGSDPLVEPLGALVERQARALGGRAALSFGEGASITYQDLSDRVGRMRSVLASRDVQPGGRVALMLKNSLFFPVAWLGVVSGGATAVPINSRLGVDDAGYLIVHSGATVVVCDSSTAAVVRRVVERLDRPVDVVEVPVGEHAPDLLRASGPASPGPATPRTLANVQYTSGTTGFPKGCLLTHGYWQRMGSVARDMLGLGPGTRIITGQPFSYIDPMWNVVATLQAGAHLVILDGFHPSTFMRDVARWGIETFYCLGVMPTLLLKQPPGSWDRDHALRLVACSAIPPGLHRDIEDRWGVPWIEAFGMTETGINIAVSLEEHDSLVGTGCIGRPLRHCEASIVDADERDVPPGQVGELRLRGLGFMEGYLDDPEATSRFFRNGWANTGDLASTDEQGRVYFRGRLKEFVRRGGENISQAEVEFALRSHHDVLDCAVAPVPDEVMGEEGKAYVVLLSGQGRDPEKLRAFLADRLAPFKVPRYYEFREDLPRTPSERIAKRLLEEGRRSWRAGTYDTQEGRWLGP